MFQSHYRAIPYRKTKLNIIAITIVRTFHYPPIIVIAINEASDFLLAGACGVLVTMRMKHSAAVYVLEFTGTP